MDRLRFAVLGPVRAWRDREELELGTPQQRAVLAVLLVRRGRTASAEELVEAIWGDEPPTRALTALRTYASRLRGVLEPERMSRQKGTLMVTEAGGYALRVPAESLDLARFEKLVSEAEHARRAGELDTAAETLRRALAEWGGEPLSGLSGPWSDAQRNHLTEQRLNALETLLSIELERGRNAEAVADLTALAAENPLRERLRGLLMLALYRCGRQAEALGVYTDTRRVLIDELGIEPGPELTELHQQILTGEVAKPAPEAAPAPARLPVPAQLPADVGDFTGRGTAVKELHNALTSGDRSAMPVAVIAGIGGMGKTTLAVHVAHLVRERYPDGQLFADLRGTGSDPANPEAVLGAFLRALGVAATAVPIGLEERTALLRSTLADRRVLLVLDNARDAEQVRPLLPGAASCAVLVTSRPRLTGLPAAHSVDLDGLLTDEAVALFGRIAGESRIDGERQIAAEIAAACGFLPLAVRIVGSRLASRRNWSVATVAERLADERRRLDEMKVGNQAVAATFELGYGQLDEEQACAFRRLALSDLHDIYLPAAATVLGRGVDDTEELLEFLVDASLLETPAPGRYRYHDLLKLFARRQAERYDTEPERTLVLHRLLDFYLASARNAYEVAESGEVALDHLATPESPGQDFGGAEQAVTWLGDETANLCAVIAEATRAPAPDLLTATDLLLGLEPLIMAGTHQWEFEQTARLVITAALEQRNPVSQCRAGYLLGLVLHVGFRLDEADEAFQHTAELARATGDLIIEAESLNGMGVIAMEQRRYQVGYDLHSQAVDGFRKLGARGSEANALGNLARVAMGLGRTDEAVRVAELGLSTYVAAGSTLGAAKAAYNLGIALHGAGRPDDAIVRYTECLAAFRATSQRLWEHHTQFRLAESHLSAGRTADAISFAEGSLTGAKETKHQFGQARALVVLGRALAEFGSADRAQGCWEQALEIFDELSAAPDAADVRALLAKVPIIR